jgi:hypothetical protein
MYFFHAPNGRMLAIAGLRVGTAKLTDVGNRGAVVREILPDHTLGRVYTLTDGPEQALAPQPRFQNAPDAGLVEACNQLLADHTFLEQQDFGQLLGANRMAAYDGASGDFGKAICFFHRADGALVGIGKKAWTIVSTDEGKTWSKPVQPPTIHTDSAKEWAGRTSDGRYAFIFNPQEANRFPLVCMTIDDGVTFSNMRVVNGEVPRQRYAGAHKNIGPQYVRGVSEWAGDGSSIQGPAAKDLWIAYSSNKEDIWVAHIPVPIKVEPVGSVIDRFDEVPVGGYVPNWRTYSPAWGGVGIAATADAGNALELDDRDPYDYAKAERVFAAAAKLTVLFKLQVQKIAPGGELDIELHAAAGSARPVRLVVNDKSEIAAFGKLTPGQWTDFLITADAARGRYTLSINGGIVQELPFAEPAAALSRLTFRTGPYRTVPTGPFPDPETDKPVAPSTFLVKDVDIVSP